MATEFKLAELTIEISEKDIKNVHLSVNPPDGRVRISTPIGMSFDAVRSFALSKLSWIRQQQKAMNEQVRETPRDYIDQESHYVWGRRCLLKVIEFEGSPTVKLRHDNLVATVRSGTSSAKVGELIEQWYREQLKEAASELIQKWESILGVKVGNLFVQKMKTHWGSCNTDDSNLRLNTDLARKPLQYLEYVIVHEMVHLVEPSHGVKFTSLMDKHFPNWRQYRDELNRMALPSFDRMAQNTDL